MEVKKSSRVLVIILVVFILISISLTGYILYDKKMLFNNSLDANDVVEENNIKEVELEDNYVKRDIDAKIENIITKGNRDKNGSTGLVNMYSANYESLLNLSDDDKLFTILNIEADNFERLTADHQMEAASQVLDGLYASQDELREYAEFNDQDNIEQQYMDYFGEKVTHRSMKMTCPGYLYDSKNEGYYRVMECGGTGFSTVYVYENKYLVKDDELDVYVNLGSLFYDSEEDVSTIYSDFFNYEDIENNTDKIYQENLSSEEADSFELTKDNYKDFQEYKFVFKKGQDGIYYFEKAELSN